MTQELRTKLVEMVKNNPELPVKITGNVGNFTTVPSAVAEIVDCFFDIYFITEYGRYISRDDFLPIPQNEEDISEKDFVLLNYIDFNKDWSTCRPKEILNTLNGIKWETAIIIKTK